MLSGRRNELSTKKHSHHGATYIRGNNRNLFTEKIMLKPDGTLPLFYEVITGEPWGKKDIELKMGDIYPYIDGIGYELEQAYKIHSAFRQVQIELIGDDTSGYRLQLQLVGVSEAPNANNPRYLKVMKNYHYDKQNKEIFLIGNASKQGINQDDAEIALKKGVRRYLLCTHHVGNFANTVYPPNTVISNKNLLLPEELPIVLALFHLSNLVRYKPEFLAKVMDSRAWGMLLSLRKEVMTRFLTLFWSFLHQTSYVITSK